MNKINVIINNVKNDNLKEIRKLKVKIINYQNNKLILSFKIKNKLKQNYFSFNDIDTFIKWFNRFYLIMNDYAIIKHIPHAATKLPHLYEKKKLLRENTFGENVFIDNFKMSDLFVDKLFSFVPGITIKAKYSRIYLDVEKYKDNEKEVMYKYGQGYIYTKNLDGKDYNRNIKGTPDNKIDKYYDTHHQKLTKLTKKLLKKHKKVLIFDLHSFSENQAVKSGKEGPFPDICIGINNQNINDDILNFVIEEIKRKGYTYKINFPYEGTIIPNNLKEKELNNVYSIMLEVNKKIYL